MVPFLVIPFMLTSTIPFFLLGIILLFLFSVVWAVFPAEGYSPLLIMDYDLESAIDIAYHAVLPSISLFLEVWVPGTVDACDDDKCARR